MKAHPKVPCSKCPFSRAVEPGALGGSSPLKYIGQAFGPFVLPCHQHCDFDDPAWKTEVMTTPQCAGAAMFRANVQVADDLPPALHRLPKDSRVFASAEEFCAHHTGISVSAAKLIIDAWGVQALVHKEMGDLGATYHPVKKNGDH